MHDLTIDQLLPPCCTITCDDSHIVCIAVTLPDHKPCHNKISLLYNNVCAYHLTLFAAKWIVYKASIAVFALESKPQAFVLPMVWWDKRWT